MSKVTVYDQQHVRHPYRDATAVTKDGTLHITKGDDHLSQWPDGSWHHFDVEADDEPTTTFTMPRSVIAFTVKGVSTELIDLLTGGNGTLASGGIVKSEAFDRDNGPETFVPLRPRHSHRAVIEYSAPPRMEVIAVGPEQFVRDALDDWLVANPVLPYDDTCPDSGGVPQVLAVVTDDPLAEEKPEQVRRGEQCPSTRNAIRCVFEADHDGPHASPSQRVTWFTVDADNATEPGDDFGPPVLTDVTVTEDTHGISYTGTPWPQVGDVVQSTLASGIIGTVESVEAEGVFVRWNGTSSAQQVRRAFIRPAAATDPLAPGARVVHRMHADLHGVVTDLTVPGDSGGWVSVQWDGQPESITVSRGNLLIESKRPE